MKKEDLEVDFCILMIKLKLCGWLSHEWTQICEKKELICKRCEKINLFWSFNPYFQMETLGINIIKSLFSWNMTNKMKFEITIDHYNNDLNLDPKEDVRTFNIII
jgi:hypothetical protein